MLRSTFSQNHKSPLYLLLILLKKAIQIDGKTVH